MFSGDVGYIEKKSETLLLTKSVSLERSNSVAASLFVSKICAIDEKYSLSLDAIVLESEIRSSFINNSSGKFLV